jgi:hypothetical protein
MPKKRWGPLAVTVVLAATALIAGVLPGSASAAPVQHNPHGRHTGYVRSSNAKQAATPVNTAGTPLLSYHGGPVMSSSTVYAIFWSPGGDGSYPNGYEDIIAQYFTDVAADSGRSNNPYSVMPQYFDTVAGGHRANYDVTFGGNLTDTDSYPADHCPIPSGKTACIWDSTTHPDLADEVASFVASKRLPGDLAHIYFVFFPPDTTSCDDVGSCAYTTYCAYHVTVGGPLYTNQAYPGPGCITSTQTQNEANNNDADLVLSAVEHEHIETITDPVGTGWWSNSDGQEIADECNFTFGTLHGSTPKFTNQINSHNYVIQEEYSNAVGGSPATGCVQGATFADVTVTSSRNPSIRRRLVKITATVTPAAPATAVPTGNVTFFVDGNPIVATLDPSGVASFTRRFGRGRHRIVARYNGDTNYEPTSSGTFVQVVRSPS